MENAVSNTLLSRLFDEYANLSPEGPYWVEGDDGDDGYDYCRKHALEKIEKAGGHLSGGYSRENDSCCHCATCGVLLDYSLTDHGQQSELEHFKTIKFRRNKTLDRQTAYHLARMLYGMDDDMDALRVAARAIRCMKSIPNEPR